MGLPKFNTVRTTDDGFMTLRDARQARHKCLPPFSRLRAGSW